MLANNLADISRLDQSKMELGLERVSSLLKRLGNPQEKFKSIHIAGTNGKGSTATFISSVLTYGGYRTGLYTSPHLERFSERIKINNDEIGDAEVDKLSADVHHAADLYPPLEPTYFEFATVLAYLYFSEKGVDIAVVETGLGGRLDATNVLTPLVTVITPISMDHSEILGDNLNKIAMEKAGIIKTGIPLVLSAQDETVLATISKVAFEKKSPLFIYNKNFKKIDRDDHRFDYEGESVTINGIRSPLYGSHQSENATVALAVLELLMKHGFKLDERQLQQGIASAILPGRFEIVSKKPYIVLDGAHNRAGAHCLASSLAEYFKSARGVFVVAFNDNKDIEGILHELSPLATDIIMTRSCHEKAYNPEVTINRSSVFIERYKVKIISDFAKAIKKGLELARGNSYLTITGSLYLVGEAKKFLREAR